MKILWLGKRFYTNKDALRERFGRMYRLPQYWQQAGQHVSLWLIDYHTRETIRENDAGMVVIAAPVFGFQMLRQIVRAAGAKRPHCIVASGDCYIGLLGWLLARISGAFFVFDVYDKYDVFSGYRRLGGFDPFDFLLKHADGLVFASHVLLQKLSARFSIPFHVAPNGIDPALFRPRNMLECRRELGLPDDLIFIGYFGSMEPDRGVADLIEAVARVRQAGAPVELLLAGKAQQELSLDVPWVRYLGMVQHVQMPLLLNASDILAIPYRFGPFMDMASSCKIAEYLACRRPLVATDTPNFRDNFPTQAAVMGGALCRTSDPADMARAITYQITARLIPPPPTNMTWTDISHDVLEWLLKSNKNVDDATDPKAG